MKNSPKERFQDGVQVKTIELPQGAKLVEITDSAGTVRMMMTERTVAFTELIDVRTPLSPQVLQAIGRVLTGQLP